MKILIAIVGLAACGGLLTVFVPRRNTALRRLFDADVARARTRELRAEPVTPADVARLPPLVQRYIGLSGAIGQPRIRNFHMTFHGEIRGGPDAAWMPFTGEQYNFYDAPSRFFIMDARRAGVPFQALHRYMGASATMRVRVSSLFTVVDAKGPEMDVAETVTLFNDMCVFAPSSLIGAPVVWREIDEHRVEATYSNAGYSIDATLVFDDAGHLVDFISDDRAAASADGETFTRMRWSTPLGPHAPHGAFRIASGGEGRWHATTGEYSYIRFVVDAIDYNVGDSPIR